jgi:Domain of unknown function (DUF397)
MTERRCGMEMLDLSRAKWRTSSHSGANGACVEVALNAGAQVLVRDTRDRVGPVLAFRPDAWRRFTGQANAGALPA